MRLLLLVCVCAVWSNSTQATTCNSTTSLYYNNYIRSLCSAVEDSCDTTGWNVPSVKVKTSYDAPSGTRFLETSCVSTACSDPSAIKNHGGGADTLGVGGCGGDFNSSSNNNQHPYAPTCSGSVISPMSRTLGEVIKLQNSSFDLIYSSDRTRGFEVPYSVKTNLTAAEVRSDITDLDIEIYDETNNLVDSQDIPNTANQSYTYIWDGLDSSNNDAWATVKYKFKIIETYSGFTIPIENLVDVGGLNIKKLGLGGWAPSVWMFYDSSAKILHLGKGGIRKVTAEALSGGGFRIAEEDGTLVHEFNSTGLITSTKLGKTGTTIYAFTYLGGKLTQISEPHGMTTTFNYSMSDLTSITNPYSQTFTVSLNGSGYIEDVTTPAAEVYEMTYSSAGLILNFKKPNGVISEFTFDADGRLERDEHSGGYYADIAEPAVAYPRQFTYTSKMGRQTTFSGDGSATSMTIIRPHGGQDTSLFSDTSASSTSYSTSVNETFTPDSRFANTSRFLIGRTTSVSGSYISETMTDSVALNSADPFDIDTWNSNIVNGTIDTDIVYDGTTKEFNITTAEGRTYRRKIDTYERPVEEQVGSLTQVDYAYTGKNLTGITQGVRATALAYNGVGLLSSITNDLSQTTSYAYDSAGRLDTVTLHDSRVIDYDFDSLGRLISVTPDGRSAHIFNYNASENLEEYAPPLISGVSNVTTDYLYNDDNQLTQINRPDGLSAVYAYDAITGLMSSVTTPTRTITYSYVYNTDLPTGYDHNSGIDINRYYTGKTVTQEYWYDNTANYLGFFTSTLSSTYPDIASDTVGGGASGSRTITYNYDNDRVLKGTGDITLTYATPNGTLTSSDFGIVDDAYGYNSFGEITAYDATLSGANKYSLDFTRDDLGRISQKIETINGGTTYTYDYTYDSTGRLTQVDRNSSTYATYSYDSNNNRTGGTIDGVSTTGVYDSQDRMTDYNSYDFTYNANGDILTKTNTVTSVVWTYTYDVEGNLLSASSSSPAKTFNYAVDPLNRRIEKRDGSTFKARYLYDSKNRIIAEINSGRSLKRRYVYVSKPNIPDYFYEGSAKFRIISDHLGSPRLVIKQSDGAIKQVIDHDAFGRLVTNTIDTSGSYTAIPFGFAGGLYDADTGLLRFGARDYDPETGRWTSKDPILFDAEDPNLYGYVFNDPVNLIDPSGTSVPSPLRNLLKRVNLPCSAFPGMCVTKCDESGCRERPKDEKNDPWNPLPKPPNTGSCNPLMQSCGDRRNPPPPAPSCPQE